jgi:hypothetical protein
MKITPDHYEHLKAAIEPLAAEITDRREAILAEGRAQDVEKRLRWDLCHAAGLTRWVCDNLYPYCNDDHLDTALRRIVTELEAGLEPVPAPTMG